MTYPFSRSPTLSHHMYNRMMKTKWNRSSTNTAIGDCQPKQKLRSKEKGRTLRFLPRKTSKSMISSCCKRYNVPTNLSALLTDIAMI
jgi:hypothetical protein